MARIVSTALLVCAVFVFGLPENGRTAELDIKHTGKGYSITCKTLGPESVDIIQIAKEDNAVSKIIANIAKDKDVVVSNDFKEKFQYSGYIKKSGSSLSLIIADPTIQEEGQYRCDVYYSDKPMHTVSSGFLKLEDRQTSKKLADLKSQMDTLILNYDKKIGHLISQMTSQKTTCDQMVTKQGTDLQGLQKKIKDLASQMTSQSKTYGENLKQQEESLQKKIKDLTSQMTSQKTTCDQMVTKQGTDLQGLQKKITDLKSQMTSQSKTYGENLKQQEESLQKKIKDLASQMTSQKTTCDQMVTKQGTDLQGLQKKIIDLKSQMTSQSKTYGEDLKKQEERFQNKIKDLKSQMTSQSKTYREDFKKQEERFQNKIKDLKSQMTSQKTTCDQMVTKQGTDLQGLQKKIKDLKSQMTSQSKTYGENLKQQEESLQKKIKDMTSQMTSQKTTCDQMVTKQGTDLQGLQKKIIDLKSQMTSQNTTYGENLKKQEESLQTKIKDLTSQMVTEKTTFQDEITKLNSQIALQKTTCNGIISTHGQDLTNLRAKVTGLISGCEKQVKDQEKAYGELKKKMDDLNGEYKYQFESIGRKRYVSMHVLNTEIEKVTKSIDGKVSSETRILNNTILQTQHDFEEKLNQLNESLGMGLGLSMDKLSNITKEFAKKDDLDAVQDRVDSVEDLLEAESEQISLLRDKVSVNEFVITSLSNKPGLPTKSPGKDPVVEVIEKVSALEQNSRNQTQQIKFLLDKDTMAANEIDDLANVTFHLNQTLNRLAQKAAVQETDMTAFCAKNSKKIDAVIKDVIVFDDVSLNKGGAYDKTTGSFTAPRAGIYGFNLVIMTRIKMKFIDIDLQVKNRKDQLVTLSSHETDQEEQNSVSVVTELKTGDVVQAIVRSTYGNPLPTEIIEFYFSVFSGYFIQPV